MPMTPRAAAEGVGNNSGGGSGAARATMYPGCALGLLSIAALTTTSSSDAEGAMAASAGASAEPFFHTCHVLVAMRKGGNRLAWRGAWGVERVMT